MNLYQQRELLKSTIQELTKVGIPITGVYMPTNETDSGIEINNEYLLQIASYHNPIFVLDVVESPGDEIAGFSNTDDLITFIMET